jgi:hypothetical protein
MATIERGGEPIDLIVGPCSINKKNVEDVLNLSQIRVKNLRGESQRAIFGTRIVPLKSRTNHPETTEDGGIDRDAIMQNIMILRDGGGINDLVTPPSIDITREVIKQTGMMVGTEVMIPHIQAPIYDREILDGKMLLWSPSVEALGWTTIPTADVVAKRREWMMGPKNPKWLGSDPIEADNPDGKETSMEKAWKGLVTYAMARGVDPRQIVVIQRGVDVPEKGKYRNLPVHGVAERTKLSLPEGVRLYFDPSNSFGPNKRDQIVQATIDAMLMKDKRGRWLYSGALIEGGSSTTDTDQHIRIDEAEVLAKELARFRNLRMPGQSIWE